MENNTDEKDRLTPPPAFDPPCCRQACQRRIYGKADKIPNWKLLVPKPPGKFGQRRPEVAVAITDPIIHAASPTLVDDAGFFEPMSGLLAFAFRGH